MAGVAKLFDGHITDKSNENVDLNDDKHKGKTIGLYFSAKWCLPCRRFTPILSEFYKKYAEEKKLEIIFMSSDTDQKAFDAYYNEMPWIKLDYEEQEKKEELEEKFSIRGFPTLILLDGDSGDVITANAKTQIQDKDKEGANFPWKSEKK